MRHIVVLPYYSDEEVQVFHEIADIWKVLTKTECDYTFLLVSRFDRKPDEGLLRKYLEIAPTQSIRSTTEGRGIKKPDVGFKVEGPTAMFWDAVEFVSQNFPHDGGFMLWFEYDMVPLVPDWLDRLEKEWKISRYVLMGKLIDREWAKENIPSQSDNIVKHINGGACYSKDFIRKVPKQKFNMAMPWDMQVYRYISSWHNRFRLRYKTTNLIEFRYASSSLEKPPLHDSAILHGVKDGSARAYIHEKVQSP
ncbi:MAG: hypothetical protein JW893_09580 [Candidatus Omnitrophica bacterium]|nr:hypothetical protein [Candidatus Omnitrophota bacterium]